MYFRNFSAPDASTTSSRGKDGSLEVKMFMTEESMVRNWPAALVQLNISAKNRGLALSIESQHGMRKATGLLPGTRFINSMQRLYVSMAACKLPLVKHGHG